MSAAVKESGEAGSDVGGKGAGVSAPRSPGVGRKGAGGKSPRAGGGKSPSSGGEAGAGGSGKKGRGRGKGALGMPPKKRRTVSCHRWTPEEEVNLRRIVNARGGLPVGVADKAGKG